MYDENDGDFQFTRGSKRQKTKEVVADAENSESQQQQVTRGKKAVGRTTTKAAAKSQQPQLEKEKEVQAGTSKRASTRRRSSPRPAAAADDSRPTQQGKGKDSGGLVVPKQRSGAVALSTTKRRTRSSAGSTNGEEDAAYDGVPQRPLTNGVVKKGAAQAKERRTGRERVSTPSPPPETHTTTRMIALPFSDTPVINRNREFRKNGGGGGDGVTARGGKGGDGGSRRSSLGLRGRRASSLIEMGHSAIPHSEVDTVDFYKHIEASGLSEPRRMRLLLTWCAERAVIEKPALGRRDASVILGGEIQFYLTFFLSLSELDG